MSTAPFLIRRIALMLALRAVAAPLLAQGDGTQKWAGGFTTGDFILSSPAVASDGTIYVGSQDNRLYAINANGALKWQAVTGDWVDSSPAIGADGTVYVGSWDGKLHAFTPAGGKKWEFATGVGNYIYSSPAIGADGTIYFGAGDGNLYALRPDGTLKWTYPAVDWIDSSPAIGANGLIYYGSWDGLVYAVRDEGAAASEEWAFPTDGPVLSSPAIGRDGTVYIGSTDGKLYALDGATGEKRWEAGVEGTIEASPAVGPDGTIYFGDGAGVLRAFVPDGTLKWGFPATNPIVSTPAVRGDGVILFGGGNSVLHALNPDGSLRWKATLGDWVDSSPAIAADGTLYVGAYDKKLYAFSGSGASVSGFAEWPMFRRGAAHTARVDGIAPGGRLVNLSTRARAGAGVNLIPGFVVQGGAGGGFLVRAVGPTLVPIGVPGALADPRLELVNGAAAAPLAQNNDWSSAGAEPLSGLMAAAGAFALPVGSKDAALHATLAPGNYTAPVASHDGGSGVALVEVYATVGDLGGRLVNLSTRGFAGTGDDVLTPGLSIVDNPVRLLIRGVGPTLAQYGVSGTLARPSITLFSGSTALASNTGWTTGGNSADLRAAADWVNAFPLIENSADSAMLVTLAPGLYTVQVTGVGGTTGEALVEVYLVP